VKYKLSGQVNRAVIYQDDGDSSEVRNVDSSSSGTRFRFRGSEDLGNGMKVGMYYEVQIQSEGSSGAYPNKGKDTDGSLGVRQANVWFSGNWGKLTIGQGSGAGHGAVEADLSGTGISGAAPGRTSFTGGMRWQPSNTATPAASAALTQGKTYSIHNAFGRNDNLRYDSPAFGPATLAVSIDNDQTWEVAGRVNTALGGGQLSAGAFYGQSSGARNVDDTYGVSAAYLFSQGTNIMGLYSTSSSGTSGVSDADTWMVKLGHKWGPNAVSIGYNVSDDQVDGFEDSGFQLGFVHSLKKANTQLYAGFQWAELDGPSGTSYDDQYMFVTGARVKFD
jgi:predicted porin